MAMERYEGQETEAGSPVTPMMELESLRRQHRSLIESHDNLRVELSEMLRADCKRLEHECKSMADAMAFIRSRQPNTNMVPNDYGQDAPAIKGRW